MILRQFMGAFLAVAVVCGTGVARAQDTRAPAAGKVDEMAGVGLYVADVPRSIKFYTDVMGMKIVYQSTNPGVPRETIFSMSGKLRGGMGVSIYPVDPSKPASRTAFGRIIAYTSSSKAMEARARAAGVETRMADDGKHLYLKDPDGYEILVYEMIGDR